MIAAGTMSRFMARLKKWATVVARLMRPLLGGGGCGVSGAVVAGGSVSGDSPGWQREQRQVLGRRQWGVSPLILLFLLFLPRDPVFSSPHYLFHFLSLSLPSFLFLTFFLFSPSSYSFL